MRPAPDRPACTLLSTGLVALVLTACGPDDPAPSAGLVVEVDTIADTVVVRTVSGSVWGESVRLVPEVSIGELEGDTEYLFGRVRSLAVGADGTIYVVDGQVPDLRAYGPDGVYLRTLGRPGEGPGELKSPDGGLAVLSDGRILVRDPGNARIQVYGTDGEPLATWSIRGTFNTSRPLFRDNDDGVYTSILIDPEAEVRDWQVGLVRIGPDGLPGDTLTVPDAPFEEPELEARRVDGEDVSVSRNSVPFAPQEHWTLHPDGYFVHGLSTDYRFTLLREGSPLRVERTFEPVEVASGERAEEERSTTRNMRFTEPGWRWNGPAIPDTKPPYRYLYAGRDGRIWVLVSQTGMKVEDLDYDPTDPDDIPDEWREPPAFDVFESDGTYLGRVIPPPGLSRYPTPVFDGDHVWAVTVDDLGVQRVVRFRLEHGNIAGP